MKTSLLFTCLLIMSFAGCSKHEMGCTAVKPETEEPAIKAYAIKDSINAIKHSSGIYYEIVDQGIGKAPTRNSSITVRYTGRLLNEAIFDQGSNENKDAWKLSSLVEGWQIGVPLLKKGGHIKLIIPSAYAYGCNGSKKVPANSVLFYDINLIDVQ